MIGKPALPSITALGLEPVDEIDHVIEPAAGTGTDAASGNRDGQVSSTRTSPADQHDVALLGEEGAAGEVIDERLVDRRALELEVGEVLRQRQLGDGELEDSIERACFSLISALSRSPTTRCGSCYLFHRSSHDLVEGSLDAVELELAHEVEEFGSFHQIVLLRLS